MHKITALSLFISLSLSFFTACEKSTDNIEASETSQSVETVYSETSVEKEAPPLKKYRFNSCEEAASLSTEDLIYIGENDYSVSDFFDEGEFNEVYFFDEPVKLYANRENLHVNIPFSDEINAEIDLEKLLPEKEVRKYAEKDCREFIDSQTTFAPDSDYTSDEVIYLCGKKDYYLPYLTKYTYNGSYVTKHDFRHVYPLSVVRIRNDDDTYNTVILGKLDLDYAEKHADLLIMSGILDGTYIYRETKEYDDRYVTTYYAVAGPALSYSHSDTNNFVEHTYELIKTEIGIEKETHYAYGGYPYEVLKTASVTIDLGEHNGLVYD